jgi:epimerase transport system membrane fusion protein
VLELDRAEAGIRVDIAEADAAIAKAGQAIAELQQEIAQLDKDRAAEVAGALRETHARLLDVAPRLQSARAALERTTVRTPYAGTVVGLAVHSVGGVIGRGERILDIVPDASQMVVEARVAVGDIADVHPGMTAEVHLTAYKQRVAPMINGTVSEVSADRFTDEHTGMAFYTASVVLDPDQLARNPQVRLYPGMPATMMITTAERTAFDYLVGPLTASFERAFRER